MPGAARERVLDDQPRHLAASLRSQQKRHGWTASVPRAHGLSRLAPRARRRSQRLRSRCVAAPRPGNRSSCVAYGSVISFNGRFTSPRIATERIVFLAEFPWLDVEMNTLDILRQSIDVGRKHSVNNRPDPRTERHMSALWRTSGVERINRPRKQRMRGRKRSRALHDSVYRRARSFRSSTSSA